MSGYRFSTVKIIPDLARYEPVNVGVILHDVDSTRIYRKFTSNWAEFKRRTGIERLPHTDGPGAAKDAGYLDALSSETGKDNLEVTKPRPVSPIKTPQETLDALFRIQISLPEKPSEKSDALRRFRSSLSETIRKMGFPDGSHEAGYAFGAPAVDRRFPHAFLKGGFPRLCIDCLSFSADGVLNRAKLSSMDIALVRISQHKTGVPRTDFRVFSAQDKDQVGTADPVLKSLEVLKLRKIRVVYRADQQHELDSIRRQVSAAA